MKEESIHHKQVSIYNPIFQETTDVDEGLADILQLIWKIGLTTGYSCQERHDMPGIAMINFLTVKEAETFVNAALRHIRTDTDWENETTYQRIIRHGCKKCWEFEVFPERIEEGNDVIGIYFSATVFLPNDDLPEVLDSLKQAVIEDFTFQ